MNNLLILGCEDGESYIVDTESLYSNADGTPTKITYDTAHVGIINHILDECGEFIEERLEYKGLTAWMVKPDDKEMIIPCSDLSKEYHMFYEFTYA